MKFRFFIMQTAYLWQQCTEISELFSMHPASISLPTEQTTIFHIKLVFFRWSFCWAATKFFLPVDISTSNQYLVSTNAEWSKTLKNSVCIESFFIFIYCENHIFYWVHSHFYAGIKMPSPNSTFFCIQL